MACVIWNKDTQISICREESSGERHSLTWFIHLFSYPHLLSGGLPGSSLVRTRNVSWFCFQQSQIVPGWDQARSEVCSLHPVLVQTLGHLPVGVTNRTCLANLSWYILGTWTNQRNWHLYSEQWLNIQGFTNFTIAHFVTKCHTVKSSQKSHFCRLHLKQHSFSHCPAFITIDEERNKNQFENWLRCCFENFCCVTTKRYSSRRTAFASTICSINLLFPLPLLVNTTLRYCSTCSSVFPLTYKAHWLAFLERHKFFVYRNIHSSYGYKKKNKKEGNSSLLT